MAKAIIVGCGYVGIRLARRLLDAGQEATGIVRSPQSLEQLGRAGISGVLCSFGSDDGGACGLDFEGAEVFVLAPPTETGREDAVTRGLVSAFEHLGHPRRVLYVSTTGVYGDCGGQWVDETWPVRPNTDRSYRRLDAEETLRDWSRSSGGELVILRVSGIYGPGRLPLDRIRKRVPLVRPEESPFTNRIHVEDLVSACVAGMSRGRSGEVYNVSDGNPSTMTQYFLDVAGAAGLPAPPLIAMADAAEHLSAGMMSYMAESRRLETTKLRGLLGQELIFPRLADGLKSLFSED